MAELNVIGLTDEISLQLRPVEEVGYLETIDMGYPVGEPVPLQEEAGRGWQWGFFFLLGSLATVGVLTTLGYRIIRGV